jgi:hypothetical protein
VRVGYTSSPTEHRLARDVQAAGAGFTVDPSVLLTQVGSLGRHLPQNVTHTFSPPGDQDDNTCTVRQLSSVAGHSILGSLQCIMASAVHGVAQTKPKRQTEKERVRGAESKAAACLAWQGQTKDTHVLTYETTLIDCHQGLRTPACLLCGSGSTICSSIQKRRNCIGGSFPPPPPARGRPGVVSFGLK